MILESGVEIEYRKVCLCAGGSPKLISENPNVLGIRDTASVLLLQGQYSTVQYSAVQCSAVQYSTVQYSTVQSRSIFIKIDNPDIRRIILTLMIFQEKLASAKRLIVVGNGGIATELGMILFFKHILHFKTVS